MNPEQFPQFFSEYLTELLIAFLVAITLGVFNERMFRYVRYVWAFISNKTVRYSVRLVERYETQAQNFLMNEVFDEIKQKAATDNITKGSVSKHQIRINSKKLGSSITIELDEELDTADLANPEKAEVLGFYVIIAAEANLQGFRDLSQIRDFITISNNAAEAVNKFCFGGARPKDSYALCEIIGLIKKTKADSFAYKGLSAQARIEGTKILVKTKEPLNLDRAVRKSLRKFI